jgi:quinoprotein glucose dehydrogenase
VFRSSLGLLMLCVGPLSTTGNPLARAAEPKQDASAGGHEVRPTAPEYRPAVAVASDQGERQIAAFKVPDGFQVKLWAAEPMVANPVCLSVDEHGRVYVGETFRIHHGVEDDRGHMDWLDDDMASKTVEDRRAMLKKHVGRKIDDYAQQQDRIRLLEDRSGRGKADHVSVFADGFNDVVQGIGAGLLARHDDVYYTCIPDLWRLRDSKGIGQADVRQSLSYGYGVRVSFFGHDLHGLKFGPDGKLYYSIGDRGFSVKTGGRTVANSETGAVFRCNPDGSDVEVFCSGLRNPQKLAFDEYGNLFTCDNNSDSGDRARWVYLVEGGDSGWRMPYQYLNDRGPFNREKIWYPRFDGQAAYIVPPIAWLADGPSGLVYYPGTGWDDKWQGHFFLCDFRGAAGPSGVRSLALKPKGASFEIVDSQEFLWHILATDVDWGPEGALYITDWVEGWDGSGKGRIYKVFDAAKQDDSAVLDVKRLIAEGMSDRPNGDLVKLLAHADMRIRQEAQFALAERVSAEHAADIVPKLIAVATAAPSAEASAGSSSAKLKQLARLHAIWALGQIGRRLPKEALAPLVPLAGDADPEVRAQAVKVLGDGRFGESLDKLLPLLKDGSLRVRHVAAIAIGKIGRPPAIAPILEMLRENDDKDSVVRHSAVMALAGSGDPIAILAAAADGSPAVRMGALLALRRLETPQLAKFLHDPDPRLVLEAARAIHDLPIEAAVPELAQLVNQPIVADAAAKDRISQEFDGRDALLRRVLNANFRLGTSGNARAVAHFAARSDVPEAMRIEALEMLADWAHPSVHDRVTNGLRPLSARAEIIAGDALRPEMGGVFAGGDRLRQVAAKVAGQLGVKEVVPVLVELAADAKQPAAVRIQAMSAVEQLRDARAGAMVAAALEDSDPTVRNEARRILAGLRPSEAIGRLEDALAKGALVEQQGALATLAKINAPRADAILAEWLDKLLANRAPRELQLDLLEAAARRATPELKQGLARFESARAKKESIDRFRETLYGGDAERGRTIFFDRTEVGCLRCHTVSGTGGKVGPDLTRIGAEKTREYLLESMIDPNKAIAKGFETVVLSLDDGRQIAGILKSEDPKQLSLMTPEGKLVTVEKSHVDERSTGKSAMPEDIAKPLSKSDLRNLVEFLSGLK